MPPPALLMRPLGFGLGPRAAGGTRALQLFTLAALTSLPGVTDAAARAPAIPFSAEQPRRRTCATPPSPLRGSSATLVRSDCGLVLRESNRGARAAPAFPA